MAKRSYKRRKKLIKPKFQMRVALCGLGISIVAVLLLMIMVNEAIMEFASNGWVDAAAMQAEWMNILLGKLLVTLALLVPFTLALGVILTHRVAGPLYRFEAFLNGVMAGEHPEPCRLRKGDELMDFCDLLNQVTEPLRNGSVPLPSTPESDMAELVSDEDSAAESTGEQPVEAEAAAA